MTTAPTTREQTPAQWAVRWHALVLTAVLLASVPVVHVVWHFVLGHDEPLLRTRSQVPPPAPTAATVRDGTWMLAKEKQLREDSPTTWWLRGHWNELRYEAGVPQAPVVQFGVHEWFFHLDEVSTDRAAFDRAQPARRRFLEQVRDLVRAAGAELLIAVVPDKLRVYPELYYADGALPPNKKDNYAAILADFEALGIASVDLATALQAERAANPQQELYYRRDTHWRPSGALVAGRTIAAAVEKRWGSRLAPRRAVELRGPTTARLIGDLAANLGMRTLEIPDPLVGTRTAPMSLLADHLAEVREYWDVEIAGPAGKVKVDGKDEAAEILLLGTSFSEENGADAIAFFLGRSLRIEIVYGADGLPTLRAALPELRAHTVAKVVIWEIVERGLFDFAWRDQKL